MKRDQELGERVSLIASAVGLLATEGPELGTADLAWWFSRPGTAFTQAVCFRFRRRPTPRLLVEYLVSPHSLARLTEIGVERNAGTRTLFDHWVIFLGRAPDSVLPKLIPLPSAADWDFTFAALQAEMLAAKETIWTDLWQACLRTGPDWERGQGE